MMRNISCELSSYVFGYMLLLATLVWSLKWMWRSEKGKQEISLTVWWTLIRKLGVRTQEIIRNLILSFELFFQGVVVINCCWTYARSLNVFPPFSFTFPLFFWGSLKWNLFHEARRADHVLKIDCFNMTIRKARESAKEEKLIPILVFFGGKVG